MIAHVLESFAAGLAIGGCIIILIAYSMWPDTEKIDRDAYNEGRDDGFDVGYARGLAVTSQPARRQHWRAEMTEQLAPAVLDAENLPGPEPSYEEARAAARQTRAGEFHLEAPLPAILHLGREYDGGDQTFARVAMRQMTAINAHEAARKALCEECGVKWVPMELIGLEAA